MMCICLLYLTAELNEKTRAMLRLIEQDADSFAQRAEMYYKKRPELISMVENFYRTHRLLAEHYDQLKSEPGTRLLPSLGSSLASAKNQSETFTTFLDRSYDSHSEFCDEQGSPESEVDDPEMEEQTESDDCTKEKEVSVLAVNDEVMRLREEMERLREENRSQKEQLIQKDDVNDEVMSSREEIKALREKNIAQNVLLNEKDAVNEEVMRLREELKRLGEENRLQNDQLKQKDAVTDEVLRLGEEIRRLREENMAQKDKLKQKDEEKIEAINHLSLAIDMLKQENVKMRKFIAKRINKNKNPFELNKVMGLFSLKFLNGSSKNQPSVVAL